MAEILYINEDTIKKLLDWDASFEAVRTALESVSKKRVFQKVRTRTLCLKSNSSLITMPGYLDDCKFGALCCKLLMVCPNNTSLEKPLPTLNANIALIDETTGILKAIISGNEITKWRTAAASAVATKYLKSEDNFEILAILGAGAQGQIHAIAFHHFFKLKEIRIWNRNGSKAKKLVDEFNHSYFNKIFRYCESNEACVRDADIIVTTTSADEPVVQLEWLKNNVHINAVGMGKTHHNELSRSIYLASHVYTDSLEGAETELIGFEEIGVKLKGEIGSIISGKMCPPQTNEITVFQSLGMAVEDCAMARLIYDLYKTHNPK